MLGHDMRNPLQAIQVTASHLAKLNAGEVISKAAAHLINSGAQMQALLDDLLAFNRTQLGLGIAVQRGEANLAEICAVAAELIGAAHPERDLRFHWSGD